MKSVLAFIKKYFTLIPVKYRFAAWVVLAFSAFLSFVSINSAWADSWGINGVFYVYGIIASVLTVAIGYIAFSEE